MPAAIALPAKSFFADVGEIDKYIGGVFREEGDHPQCGPKFRAANIVMRVIYTDPDCELMVAARRFSSRMRPKRSQARHHHDDACRCGRPIVAYCDPDVRITYYGTEIVPYAGDYRGIDEATMFCTKVGQNIEIVEIQV